MLEDEFELDAFDHICAREIWHKNRCGFSSVDEFFKTLSKESAEIIKKGGNFVFLQSIPAYGQRISNILLEQCDFQDTKKSDIFSKIEAVEKDFFESGTPMNGAPTCGVPTRGASIHNYNWTEKLIEECFLPVAEKVEITLIPEEQNRLVTGTESEAWFNTEKSVWAKNVFEALGKDDFFLVKNIFSERAKKGPFLWRWKSALCIANF
jgi:hypothetical protein